MCPQGHVSYPCRSPWARVRDLTPLASATSPQDNLRETNPSLRHFSGFEPFARWYFSRSEMLAPHAVRGCRGILQGLGGGGQLGVYVA